MKIKFFLLFLFVGQSKIVTANSFGFGLLGGWGFGYSGFNGKIIHEVEKNSGERKQEKAEGKNRFSNSFSVGAFVNYSFGKEREEFYTFLFSVSYVQREIDFVFKTDNQTKSNTYYRDFFHKFTQKGIEIIQKNYFLLISGNYVELGMHFGFGLIYSFKRFICDRDALPTSEEEERGKKELGKINIFPLVGLVMPFLDRMMSLEVSFQYWILDQGKEAPSYKHQYGKKFSLGSGHMSAFFEIKINFWEMIRG